MLRNAKALEQFELRARDGKIGHVQDLFFDDRQWTVRYLVIDTGTWLDSRKVLIAPTAVSGGADWENRILPVALTQAQVRGSPSIDTEQPVSREHEAALTQYYNWPAYWGAAGFPEAGFAPIVPIIPLMPTDIAGAGGTDDPTLRAAQRADAGKAPAARAPADHHMRSVRAVTGHTLEATDGSIGHVDDFLIDDATWRVRYLVIDTRNWWPGKKVLVSPEWIHEVGWDVARVYVDLTRAAVKASPPYDPHAAVTADYAGRLHSHYGRPPPTAFF